MLIKLKAQQGPHEKDSIRHVATIVPHGGHTDSACQYVLDDGTHVASDNAEVIQQAFNINNYVWVKLTKEAKEYLSRAGNEYLAKQTKGGWTKVQMWELMQHFGPTAYVGSTTMFEGNEIHFSEPEIPPVAKDEREEKLYHVVLKRVYNVIVDRVKAKSELEAIKAAEIHCDKLARKLNNIEITERVHLDDGDQPISALVDTYTAGGDCYEEEEFYQFDENKNGYVKKE